MSKKYMSMQEELAARRAASENREVTAERSDLAASGHFERSGQKGPMSRRGSSHRPGQANRSRQANRPESTSRPRPRGPEKMGGASLHRGTVVIVVVLVAVIAIAAIVAGYMHSKELQPEPTDWTQATESTRTPTESTWAPRSEDAEIDEWASLNDIYAYMDARTEPMEEPESLYGEVYWDIREIIYQYQKDCNWYIHEGRIFVSPQCALDDDPQTLAATWREASDKIHKKLETANKENASVIIAIRSNEDWRLRMLLIDGETEFVSEIWEP